MDQQKKMSTGTLVLLLVGGCIGFSVLMGIGKSLGYAGVALGLLGVSGCAGLLLKGPPQFRKLALGSAALSILLVIFSFRGADENKKEAEQQAAAVAAAERKAADDKAKLDKAVTKLDTKLPQPQLASTCMEVARAGAVPAAHAMKCADVLLVEGETALAANDLPRALAIAQVAQQYVGAGLRAKPDDAALKELVAKVAAVVEKADPEKIFAAMSAKEHLAAAKAAMKDGFDAQRKWGGDLQRAARHLAAVEPAAPEVGEAKRLQDEIDARKKREQIITCDCELVGGRLVVAEGADDVFPRLADVGVSGPKTLKYNASHWFELPEVQSITVVEHAKYTDVRGNEQRIKTGEFTVTRAKAKGINWEKVSVMNVLKVIDKAWMAPGVTIVELDE